MHRLTGELQFACNFYVRQRECHTLGRNACAFPKVTKMSQEALWGYASCACRYLLGMAILIMGLVAPVRAESLTLAISNLPHAAPLIIADAQGYFADEGLSLNIVHCVNGRRCLQHLFDGQAQFATVGDTPAVLSSFVRNDFAMVATIAASMRTNKFAVRTDRGIQSPADLAGKRIGLIKGTTGHYFVETFLLYHGISAKQVTLVALAQENLVAELAAGRLDAAGGFEPMGYHIRKEMGSDIQFLPNPMIYNATVQLIASKAALANHKVEVVKMLRAIQRANKLIKDEPAQARAIVARRAGFDRVFIDAVWDEFQFNLSLDQSLVSSLSAQARWALRAGLVSGERVPNFLDIMHPEPLRSVSRRAATVAK